MSSSFRKWVPRLVVTALLKGGLKYVFLVFVLHFCGVATVAQGTVVHGCSFFEDLLVAGYCVQPVLDHVWELFYDGGWVVGH